MTVVTDTGELVDEYRAARDRLDACAELIERALLIREMLAWGGIDMDELRHEVSAFKRECEAVKKGKV